MGKPERYRMILNLHVPNALKGLALCMKDFIAAMKSIKYICQGLPLNLENIKRKREVSVQNGTGGLESLEQRLIHS